MTDRRFPRHYLATRTGIHRATQRKEIIAAQGDACEALRLAIEEGPPVIGFDMACPGPGSDLDGLRAQLAARCAVEVIGGLGWKRALAANQARAPKQRR